MAEKRDAVHDANLAQIEADDRIVVLARTIRASDPGAEMALKSSAIDGSRFEETCLGRAVYRHGSVFQNTCEAPLWSHLEFSYFRRMVPSEVIRDLVIGEQPQSIGLLRAEILLTTPASFVLPRDWQGSTARPERQASLEFIDVKPAHLGEYREIMREYCGPAATKLVQAGKFGTFRAMETAVVLHQAPELKMQWNQIHLCELEAEGFGGFGREFAAAMQDDPADADKISSAFAGLDRMRMVPGWTVNDVVLEEDAALALLGSAHHD
ncbi:hypothetical protein [Jiella marina]|uniref:hypothetical protein n=1 Tax=Jiella sp. LLJ827 TaxID=2917712 RepID=UPI0021016C9F|nr:hypothetical protein [Jiella sp. LLJ827]MCQ0987866.1 hypothetical protein [Jiella sp. LLJ827]